MKRLTVCDDCFKYVYKDSMVLVEDAQIGNRLVCKSCVKKCMSLKSTSSVKKDSVSTTDTGDNSEFFCYAIGFIAGLIVFCIMDVIV